MGVVRTISNQLTDRFTSSYIFWRNTVKGTSLTEVILVFSTVRATKPRILIPKRYDDHPGHFYIGDPHYTRPRAVDSKTIRNCLCVGSLYKLTQSLNERPEAIRKWNVEFETVEGL